MILKKEIKNNNKNTDYVLSITLTLASFGFLITGLSSFLEKNLIFFINYKSINFVPQGLTMGFYGTLGLILGIHQINTLIFNIGEGYNEFDKEKGIVTIFRKNYPGKNPTIELKYSIKDIFE